MTTPGSGYYAQGFFMVGLAIAAFLIGWWLT